MKMIRDNQFDGRIWFDHHRHVAYFLEISNLFQYSENQEEAVKLRTFPFSLTREAKTWINELDKGNITSWNEMREAFISRYFSPVMFKRLLNDIYSLHQLIHKTLIDAWLQMKEMFRTCYEYGLTKGEIIQIFYHGLDDPTQEILDAGEIFLYKTPNEAFKILEDKVLLKLDFSDDSQNIPKLKTVVYAGGSNINSSHEILMEKIEALATKISFEFLIIRKEIKEMRDGRMDDEGHHAPENYTKDNTPMGDPMEANYVQGYHGRYHDQDPRNSYFYHNPNHHYPQSRPHNRMPHPSQYFKIPETSPDEMMRKWMSSQIKANEEMKNQVVELERKISHGLRNHQAIIQNLERQFEFLEKKNLCTDSLPLTTNTKLRHEFDCIVHISYTHVKKFKHDEILNHVGEKELKSIDGVGTRRMTKKEKNDKGMPKEPNKE
ncbi:reverse transcriptase domain-containing protein [Tanacetum coccineum]